jgi:hypothetical protein
MSAISTVPARPARRAHGGQGGDWMRQVVQALECGDQVVWAAVGGGGDVGLVHADPVGYAGRGDVTAGQLDRGGVEVVAVHAEHRVAPGQADA